MDFEALNREKFDYLGITDCHNRGITGQGIKILILEIKPILEDNKHANKVYTILKSVVPDAHIEVWDTSDIDEALQYAIDNQFDIVNMSSSGLSNSIYKKAYDAGIFLITSAGNTHGKSCTYAANLEEFIAVTSITKDMKRSSFSPVDADIDIAMYGEFKWQDQRKDYEDHIFSITGTSFSCPLFAGMLGLYIQVLGYRPTREQIYSRCLDIYDTGHDNDSGYGVFILPETIKNKEDDYMFTDVDYKKWYGPAVKFVEDNKLMHGYEDGTFKGEHPITRYEMAQILYNLKIDNLGE